MPRKKRIEIPGSYHIINSGIVGNLVYEDDEDREYFLNNMCRVFNNYNIALHSYTLLENSYHLLITTHDENLSQAMREVNSQYSFYFNKKYQRYGHLWQDRFKSYYILDDEHFINVFKYIEKQSLMNQLVKSVNEYEWQSYNALVGENEAVECLKGSRILKMFGKSEIIELVESSLRDNFLEDVFRDYPKGDLTKDTKPISAFFGKGKEQIVSILEAVEHGYSQKAIAKYLDVSSYVITKKINEIKS